MSSGLNTKDLEQIQAGIRDKYAKVAVSTEGQFKYPTGRAGLEQLNYDATLIADLPEAVAGSFCGVGNPFSLGDIPAGSHLLDIGCGAGVDALFAAKLVRPAGRVVGIDITPEMIERAEANKKKVGAENVVFQLDRVQDLTGLDERFDVVTSNGALNLIPEKKEVMEAVFRLLKPGGRFFVADQFLVGPTPKDMQARIRSWFQ
ncbi:MAG: methyltransferase domain-containing protein [Desulfobacterales bacterium]